MGITQNLDTKRYISGINQAWFDNQYATDIGFNQFSDRAFQIGDGQTNGWETLQTDRPDPNPPLPKITNDPTTIGRMLLRYKGKADLCRIWVSEQLEGIQFTFNSGDSTNRVTGIDRTHLLPNLKKILDMLQYLDIQAYLTLFHGFEWDANYTNPYTSTKGTAYAAWHTTKMNAMTRIMINAPTEYINNFLRPLLREIGDHPAFWGIDVMNEGNAIPYLTFATEAQLWAWFNSIAVEIKNRCPRLRISMSLTNTAAEVNSYFNGTNMKNYTHIDFHTYYTTSTSSGTIGTDLQGRDNISGYKALLGESGPYYADPTADKVTLQDKIYDNSWTRNYKGALAWLPEHYESTNETSLLNKIQEYKNRTV